MTIHSPSIRQGGLMRLPMLAIASALLVAGFAAGQATPNVIGAFGGALDSAQTQSIVAPALTDADDYGLRHRAAAPGRGTVNTQNERTRAAAAGGGVDTTLPDAGDYVERAGGR